jgi:lipopolysaccharide assembly outer membrane protein LptD (OstA)
LLVLFSILLSLSILPSIAVGAELPEEARLSADRMRFDSQTGDFLATGNVLIQAGGLVVAAPRGVGNARNKEVYFSEGIVASGDWRGDWIDLTAGTIELHFDQPLACTAEGEVRGDVGKISIDADKLYMKGPDISARNVRRLEDREAGIAFGADDVAGTLMDGVLTALTAKKKVWLQGRPGQGGDMADIRGDMAVYSVERGSVVLSGNVRAVQKGRTLTAQSLVYFPASNRVEAIGGVRGGGTVVSEDRATITIDLRQEKQKRNKN